jgi:hypothetical protein
MLGTITLTPPVRSILRIPTAIDRRLIKRAEDRGIPIDWARARRIAAELQRSAEIHTIFKAQTPLEFVPDELPGVSIYSRRVLMRHIPE